MTFSNSRHSEGRVEIDGRTKRYGALQTGSSGLRKHNPKRRLPSAQLNQRQILEVGGGKD
jgi:hypothetical protein